MALATLMKLRIARPVSDLDRSVAMYCSGLGFSVLGDFREHRGFDGAMLGEPGSQAHFEFVVCRDHPLKPSPTPEDLIVLYLPERSEWQGRCSAVLAAGFTEVEPFNPYWSERGRTFEDPDGYRVVLQNAAWSERTSSGELRSPAAAAHVKSGGTHSEANMAKVEQRLQALGLVLPASLQLPAGAVLPFPWVRVVGSRALISGHGPTNTDGSLAQPLGKVGADVTLEQGYAAARLTGLAILASLKRELGDLDRIACWIRVFGMVNSAPGFHRQPAVINGFTDLIVEVFGAQVGAHARSAVGMAELPFNIPVEVEGEVSLVER